MTTISQWHAAVPGADQNAARITPRGPAARRNCQGQKTLGQRRRLVSLDAGQGRCGQLRSCTQTFSLDEPSEVSVSAQTPRRSLPRQTFQTGGNQTRAPGRHHVNRSVPQPQSAEQRTRWAQVGTMYASIYEQVTVRSSRRNRCEKVAIPERQEHSW